MPLAFSRLSAIVRSLVGSASHFSMFRDNTRRKLFVRPGISVSLPSASYGRSRNASIEFRRYAVFDEFESQI